MLMLMLTVMLAAFVTAEAAGAEYHPQDAGNYAIANYNNGCLQHYS